MAENPHYGEHYVMAKNSRSSEENGSGNDVCGDMRAEYRSQLSEIRKKKKI